MRFVQQAWTRYLALLARLTLWFEGLMDSHGRVVARNPKRVAVFAFVVAAAAALGLLNLRVESDGEKLWVPQNSDSKDYQDYAEDEYNDSDRFAAIIIGADIDGNQDNVLDDSTFIYSLFDIDQKVKSLSSKGLTYESGMCLEAEPGRCVQNGVLEFWNNSISDYSTRVGGSSDVPGDQTQLIADINVEVFADNAQVVQETIFYRPEYNESGSVVRAELAQVYYVFTNAFGDSTFESWASDFHDLLDDAQRDYSNIEIHYSTSFSFEEELDKAITGDIFLIVIAFVAISLLTMAIFFRRNQVQSRVSLGAIGVLSVFLSIAMGYGLAAAFSIPFTSLTMILPFVLVGIGVDDVFVLASGLERAKASLPDGSIEELMAFTMRSSGLSITVTSLTNLLAFLLGSSTVIPAIQWFCWYAALAVLSDYVLQITFFLSFMVLTERRIASGAYDLAPCCSPADADSSSAQIQNAGKGSSAGGAAGGSSGSTEFVRWFREKPLTAYAAFITSGAGVAVVLLVHIAFAALSIVGVTRLEQGLPLGDLAPDGSYFKEFMDLRDDTYNEQIGQSTFIYFRDFDQSTPANQEAMYLSWQDTLDNKYIDKANSQTATWLTDYTDFVESQGVALETLPSGYQAIPQDDFYTFLASFIEEFGTYDRHIVLRDDGTILTSRFEVLEDPVGDDYTKQAKILRSIKSLEKDLREDHFGTDDEVVFIFNQSYVFTESDLILVQELLLNLGLAALGVFIVSLLLLVDPRASFLVVFGIVSVDLFLLGELWIGNIRLNTVSVINLVMAVGLSVDYSVHLAHAFVFSAQGDRRERVRHAIIEIGPAILTGAGTTLIGVILLSGSTSEIARTFFRLLLGTVIYGVWNGMAFTPVMLSLLGPVSVAEAHALSSAGEKQGGPDKKLQQQQHVVVTSDLKAVSIEIPDKAATTTAGTATPDPEQAV